MNADTNLIAAVWRKGRVVPGVDPNKWRKDACGAWISYSQYGNRDSVFGWEIDHIVAAKPWEDDDDSLSNLQPLHWANNAAKSDGALVCAVTADGNKNVRISA